MVLFFAIQISRGTRIRFLFVNSWLFFNPDSFSIRGFVAFFVDGFIFFATKAQSHEVTDSFSIRELVAIIFGEEGRGAEKCKKKMIIL